MELKVVIRVKVGIEPRLAWSKGWREEKIFFNVYQHSCLYWNKNYVHLELIKDYM